MRPISERPRNSHSGYPVGWSLRSPDSASAHCRAQARAGSERASQARSWFASPDLPGNAAWPARLTRPSCPKARRLNSARGPAPAEFGAPGHSRWLVALGPAAFAACGGSHDGWSSWLRNASFEVRNCSQRRKTPTPQAANSQVSLNFRVLQPYSDLPRHRGSSTGERPSPP